MAKTCVFCGKKPDAKTKEHVIPKWLIALTGNPKRSVDLGWDKKKFEEKELVPRSFAFDQFCFPACKKCNERYAEIEGSAKVVAQKILADQSVTSEELTLFLDWIDKVRIGLWLGFMQLDGNYAGVSPNFHINDRVGQRDRLLIIQKSDLSQKRLNFAGVDCLAFSFMPSVFSLAINNYFFTNISYQFLFARRLGFPYADDEKYLPDGRSSLMVHEGEESITLPLISHPLPPCSVAVFQPMFRGGLIEPKVDYYDTEYVRRHSLDVELGTGNIFVQRDSELKEISSGEMIELTPSAVLSDSKLRVGSIVAVHEWQNWLFSQTADMSELSDEHKKHLEHKFAAAKDWNDAMIEHHENILAKF